MARYSAYCNLENTLRRMICARQLPEEHPIRSENALAKQYGICRNSVRKAIDHLVRDGLLKRVRGSGTFVVSMSARKSMQTDVPKQGKTILYLSFSSLYPRNIFLNMPRFQDVFSGWDEVFSPHGYQFLAAHVGMDWTPPECLLSKDVAGVIFDGYVTSEFFERYLHGRLCVGVNGYNRAFDCSWVLEDVVGEKELQVEYLLAHGYRRIAIQSDESELPTSKDGLEAFKLALAKNGVAYNPDWVLFWTRPKINGILDSENISRPPDYSPYLRRAFLGKNPPEAIICIDEWRAVNTLRGLERLGFKVPEDVGIICRVHPERSFASYHLPFNFTGFHCRKREVFLEASQLLLEEIEGCSRTTCKTIYLKPFFVQGESLLDRTSAD